MSTALLTVDTKSTAFIYGMAIVFFIVDMRMIKQARRRERLLILVR